ncbi:MAG: efflux RND transporter periplasmic adaptor subunit [Hyphomicrobiaceae bacterium]
MLNKRVREPREPADAEEARDVGEATLLQAQPRIATTAERSGPAGEGTIRHAPGRGWRAMIFTAKAVVPLLALAAGFAGFSYLKATKPEAPKQPRAERVFAVTAIPAIRTTEQPLIKLYGTIVAGRQVDIRTLVAGRVVATSDELREGGRVATGATLLSIDAFDYRSALTETKAQLEETNARIREQEAANFQAKTSLKHARAQFELAKADVERAESLQSRGNASEKATDDRRQIMLQRQQAADVLANEIGIWDARIAQSRATAQRLAVAMERAERRLAETELQAPFDAYVTEVGAQVGRMLSVNDKVATLIDAKWIEAQFTLTDSQFGRMVTKLGKLEGSPVTVRWMLGRAVFEYSASITRVGARVSSATGGVDVFARIGDPLTPVALRPGAFVEVLVPDVSFENVVRMPSSALYDRDTVYVIADGRLAPRQVTVVGTSGSDLLVQGDLQDSDRIVTTRLSTPGKGLAVKESIAP